MPFWTVAFRWHLRKGRWIIADCALAQTAAIKASGTSAAEHRVPEEAIEEAEALVPAEAWVAMVSLIRMAYRGHFGDAVPASPFL